MRVRYGDLEEAEKATTNSTNFKERNADHREIFYFTSFDAKVARLDAGISGSVCLIVKFKPGGRERQSQGRTRGL